MRALITVALLFAMSVSNSASATDHSTPYIEISVHGLEELAPPMNRLADAVEELAQSDKLSAEDQQKIVSIIGELKQLSSSFDDSLQQGKQKFSQAQQELSDSVKQVIMLALLGLVASIIIICAAIFALFRFQIAPLLNTTSSSLETFAGAMERLSASSEIIAATDRSNQRRFARQQPRLR